MRRGQRGDLLGGEIADVRHEDCAGIQPHRPDFAQDFAQPAALHVKLQERAHEIDQTRVF